jgi:hypothetical protein
MEPLSSPQALDAKAVHVSIRRDQLQPVFQSLGHNNPIKRITIGEGKQARACHVAGIDTKHGNAGFSNQNCQIEIRRHDQFAKMMLVNNLVERCGTNEQGVRLCFNQSLSCVRKALRLLQNEQDNIGIQQISQAQRSVSSGGVSRTEAYGCTVEAGLIRHASDCSRLWYSDSSALSGSGPKCAHRPIIRCMPRGSSFVSVSTPTAPTATSFATGLPRRAITTSSPRSARATKSDSLAFASATLNVGAMQDACTFPEQASRKITKLAPPSAITVGIH